jgi:hypothetical protein
MIVLIGNHKWKLIFITIYSPFDFEEIYVKYNSNNRCYWFQSDDFIFRIVSITASSLRYRYDGKTSKRKKVRVMISIRLRGRRDELNTFTLIYSTCHIRRFLLSLFVCLLVLFSIIYFVGLRRYQSRTQVWYLRMKIFHYYLYFL